MSIAYLNICVSCDLYTHQQQLTPGRKCQQLTPGRKCQAYSMHQGDTLYLAPPCMHAAYISYHSKDNIASQLIYFRFRLAIKPNHVLVQMGIPHKLSIISFSAAGQYMNLSI